MSDSAETIPSSGDTNFGPVLIGVNWAVFGPSTILVGLRLVTRVWITHNFGWDDTLILLAQIVNAVGMGFVMLEVYYGLGRHVQYLPADHYVGFLKYNFLDWVQVFMVLALSKISICLFLLRISKFERWRNFLFGLIGFIIITHTPLTILFLLQCIPLNKNWDTSVPGHCFSKPSVEVIIIIQGVISVITDFIGAAFPILLLLNAKLHLRTKIALDLLMGLGVVTGTVCIVRTAYCWEILSDDVTWVGVGNALTRILEVNFGIIGACAPIMRPLYIHLRARFFHLKARESLDCDQTPASKLQWYSPPTSTPWYKRIFHAPAATDKPDVIAEPAANNYNQPMPKQRWPRPMEKPDNAIWAKDNKEPDLNDSFDLPLQGTRKSGYNDNGNGDEEEADPELDVFETYRYHRGWV
ncbi:hypothetical protein OEA41_007436 [Lepraria neglecta]|uniref:Rhodopsin domain-containing protein n=1 Tax=Lepraria neglecta TaxID=209136 RepID=A0AAE0DN27_9LECA|nr:hypothetical protein OEA41_007436 [Lepraria neglecta]